MIRIAVLIPCFNEEIAIAGVVAGFRAALPTAVVYVYDNASTDGTAAAARLAGAVVRREALPGKGNVVRRMFADIEADAYVLVDGDATYDPATAPLMLRLLVDEQFDMVVARRETDSTAAYRPGHQTGNYVLTLIVRILFGNRVSDMLSGYRAFSRRFVKSFPALSTGFETETELTVHALELAMPVGEVASRYKDRPPGSTSKLRTYTDGVRILRTIVLLLKEVRPFQFFLVGAVVLAMASLVLAAPIVTEFLRTGLVPRVPTAILSTGLMILAFLSTMCSFILDSVARGRKEAKRIAYLAIPAIGAAGPPRREPVADARVLVGAAAQHHGGDGPEQD